MQRLKLGVGFEIPLRIRTIAVCTMLTLCATQVQAQSFLEKLEEAVRDRMNSVDPPNGAAEELPAPKKSSGSGPKAPIESILESPSSSLPVPTPTPPLNPPAALPQAAVGPTEEEPVSGRIFLGLEAEEPIGGGIGVRVSSVTQRSPAWKAGVKTGDRIQAINGYAIANLDAMVARLGKAKPGETLKLLVLRAGRNIELTAVLMDAGLAANISANISANNSAVPKNIAGSAWLGVVTNDLTTSFRQQFGITAFRGAAVTRVTSGSPAQKAGIRAGDAIIEAGGKPIERAEELLAWMTQVRPGQNVELMVYRGNSARAIQVVLEVKPGVQNRAAIGQNRIQDRPSELALGPATQPVEPRSVSMQALQAENQELRSELAEAQRRLDATQRQLNQILSQLKAGGK